MAVRCGGAIMAVILRNLHSEVQMKLLKTLPCDMLCLLFSSSRLSQKRRERLPVLRRDVVMRVCYWRGDTCVTNCVEPKA